MSSDEVIDLGAMILIIGEALVNLRARHARETAAGVVDGCSVDH